MKRQDDSLTSIRNRATGILSAAALVSAFATGIGLINTDPSKGSVFPHWAVLGLMAILVVMAVLHVVVLWPVGRWQFGPDVRVMVAEHYSGFNADEIRRRAIDDVLNGMKNNKKSLDRRFLCYQVSAALLVGEVVLVVAASAVK